MNLWEGDDAGDEQVDVLTCGTLVPCPDIPEDTTLYDARGAALRRQRVVGFKPGVTTPRKDK